MSVVTSSVDASCWSRCSGRRSPVVVDDVVDEFVLQLAEEAEVKAREADRSKLRIATHWAQRHRVDDVLEAAHWSDADVRDGARRSAVRGRLGPRGRRDPVGRGVGCLGAHRDAGDVGRPGHRAPASQDTSSDGGAAARALARQADRAAYPPAECRSGGVRRREGRPDRRHRRPGADRAPRRRGGRAVRRRGAGGAEDDAKAAWDVRLDDFPGRGLGRHLAARDHRRHPDGHQVLRPHQRSGPRAPRPLPARRGTALARAARGRRAR